MSGRDVRTEGEFERPAGPAVRSEGSPQGRRNGARLFAYFLIA